MLLLILAVVLVCWGLSILALAALSDRDNEDPS
jgi:hypothetical protein